MSEGVPPKTSRGLGFTRDPGPLSHIFIYLTHIYNIYIDIYIYTCTCRVSQDRTMSRTDHGGPPDRWTPTVNFSSQDHNPYISLTQTADAAPHHNSCRCENADLAWCRRCFDHVSDVCRKSCVGTLIYTPLRRRCETVTPGTSLDPSPSPVSPSPRSVPRCGGRDEHVRCRGRTDGKWDPEGNRESVVCVDRHK